MVPARCQFSETAVRYPSSAWHMSRAQASVQWAVWMDWHSSSRGPSSHSTACRRRCTAGWARSTERAVMTARRWSHDTLRPARIDPNLAYSDSSTAAGQSESAARAVFSVCSQCR